MRGTEGTDRRLRRGLGVVAGAVLVMTMAGCAQPEPDQQQVADAVGRLPGVTSVDASFTGLSLGGAGDQEIEVQVANPPDARQVEDLTRSLPKVLKDIKHADGYDEFVITTQGLGEEATVTSDASSLTFGPALTPAGLATRWARAVATSPPGGLQVRTWPSPRRAQASLSSHDSVSTALAWALGSGLTDLGWSVVEYQTPETPYVRFSLDRPLAASMVEEWKTIEATYAGDDGAASIARAVVVEDSKGVRKVRVAVSYPTLDAPLTEAVHGPAIWPIVDAINTSMPSGHRLDLDLARSEPGTQAGGAGDAELVDGGTGASDWEAAYRQRYPDAVPVSATPK